MCYVDESTVLKQHFSYSDSAYMAGLPEPAQAQPKGEY